MFRTHTCGELRAESIGTEVNLCGWVHSRRDHGGIIFVDLRDRYGLTQVVFDPRINKEAHKLAESIRSEWVLQCKGKVRDRGEELHNPNLETGDIEVEIHELKILNKAQTPPFELEKEVKNEDLRLQYRYLDLRRQQMQRNLELRHKMCLVIREYFDKKGFWDVETPIMVKGTPEGSREYLVPSRLHPGKFYVLPQSPQQLKQLLMVGGIDRYFQIARCFRDEDLRGDRQPEFTQFELEMSFVDQEDVMDTVEDCFHDLTAQCAPQKNWKKYLKDGRFVRFTWHEAMERYGTDKPDIRFGLEFVNITDESKECGFGIFEKAEYISALPVSQECGELSRKDIDDLTDIARQNGAGGLAWFRVGEESGPVAKNATKDFLDTVITKTKAKPGDLIFFGAGSFIRAVEPLGAVRNALGKKFQLAEKDDFAYAWVYDFPLFEQKEDGTMQAAHHPFTSPHLEDLEYLKSDPLRVRSYAYDVVLNGVELGGGSVRIHDPELQHTMFEVLGLSEEETQRRFGHLLKAFQYGCPPHGGCAMGLDRVVMMFADEPNIREVIAFPKNQSAQDLMLGAPAPMPEKELREQNIQVLEESD
ncbi:aspartate--tRNA ligase [Candidatus Gracilibacteria bacterium]|nr:aspartate--tRNA ligase [Candidatus Gracilibacteria bacterium]MCF7819361.1 aspartate--tRNA ligase [Candidatus Gracilibacteria bacterium]